MDDETPTNEDPKKEFNKLDLSQLQSFSFGTQWTQDKGEAAGRAPRGRDDRARREGAPAADPRRDRRGFRRPHGAPGGAGDEAPRGGREYQPDRREPGSRERAGEGGGGRAPYRGPRHEGPAGGFARGPYISPHFTVTFYPEDISFSALAKTIRASCRTFELFDIAKTVLGKNDRFVVVVQRRAAEGGAGGGAEAARQPLYISVPDGVPFETEEAAVDHVLKHHLDRFFDSAEVEVDAPKGNFQVINRCGVTGELLGPPNYHRYNQIVQQYHATHSPRMPFEVFRARIESVRDPEAINQWLEKMKKVTRFTLKQERPAGDAAAAPAEDARTDKRPEAASEPGSAENPAREAAGPDATAAEGTAAEASAAEAAAAEAPATETPVAEAPAASAPAFDSPAEARVYLLTQAREKVVRAVDHGRFHGHVLAQMPDSEIKRAVEGALERQRRFPLDTANALRGRLRREGFTIFKKGSKGVSYVCAVKRKFRVPGQTFADSIGQLIGFIGEHPMVKASELPQKFLGLGAAEPGKPSAPEEQQRLQRMQGDLRWLVAEGYVTEFIDGSLFAPPPMVEGRKCELESGEGDTENFPEPKPATAPAGEPARAKPASEEPPAEQSAAEQLPAQESPVDETPPAPEAVRPATDEAPVQPEMPEPAPPAEESAENRTTGPRDNRTTGPEKDH